jgi:hypothetical protein
MERVGIRRLAFISGTTYCTAIVPLSKVLSPKLLQGCCFAADPVLHPACRVCVCGVGLGTVTAKITRVPIFHQSPVMSGHILTFDLDLEF